MPKYNYDRRIVTRYELSTGTLIGHADVRMSQKPDPGQGFLEGRYDCKKQFYCDKTEDIIDRMPMSGKLSAVSIELGWTIKVLDLPDQCFATVEKIGKFNVSGGELSITPDCVGHDHFVTIESPGYLTKTFYFEVLEPSAMQWRANENLFYCQSIAENNERLERIISVPDVVQELQMMQSEMLRRGR